jgi:hypothetical protein
MTTLHPPTRETLLRIREDLSSRLFRDSEDYRVLIALQHAIGLLDAPPPGSGPAQTTETAPGAVQHLTDSAFDILERLTRGGSHGVSASRRRLPPFADPAQGAFSQRDMVASILREQGEPTPIAELLELMQVRGVVVGGSRPQGNLSSNLSQDKRFYPVRHRDRSCWWLVDDPIPGR